MRFRLLRVALAALLASGCADEISFVEVAPANVAVALSAPSAEMGSTLQANATVRDANGRSLTGWDVSWSTSNTAIALVDAASGQVTALAPGSVQITGTSAGATGTAALQVTWPNATRDLRGRLSSGQVHTCALDALGEAYCWGINNFGQLGNNSTVGAPVPVRVEGGLRFEFISAGAVHTCGISEGQVYCWGNTASGRLGNGVTDRTSVSTPQPISDDDAYVWVDAGGSNTCGITTEGIAKCWGPNGRGQLGAPTTQSCVSDIACSGVPLPVATDERFVMLEAGRFHTCGVTTDGDLFCWGNNEFGELGGGTVTGECADFGEDTSACSIVPVQVTFPAGAQASVVSVGFAHSCAIAGGGILYCWGDNEYGQLGDGSSAGSAVPVRIRQGTTLVAVDWYHTCAVLGGPTFCWGRNNSGQLGDGTTTNASSPIAISMPHPTRIISPGQLHTCSINIAADLQSGGIYCWGVNSSGQLGAPSEDTCGTAPCSLTPLLVSMGGGAASSSVSVTLRGVVEKDRGSSVRPSVLEGLDAGAE